MYIRKSSATINGKKYTSYFLVESIATPKGPRQRTICSLGKLDPGPPEKWLALARKVELALSGQTTIEPVEPMVEQIVEKANAGRPSPQGTTEEKLVVPVYVDKVEIEDSKEAGPVHVGNEFWERLEMEAALECVGLSERARFLTRVMTMNRLVSPAAEHAMPDWIKRTALGDILETDLSGLADDALYRNLDRLHKCRESIEKDLAKREKDLFNLDDTIYLYDLTSTYFEGQCPKNEQAKRGYSRDKRPDCKQVVVGLVVNRDGFPAAHEVFEGNRVDQTTVAEMLDALERRIGHQPGITIVVDRGMAFEHNLKEIVSRKYHYVVAARQDERKNWLEEFEDEGWQQLIREPSSNNKYQRKSVIRVKPGEREGETYVLCLSEERTEKDKAIRETHEKRFLDALKALRKRVQTGRLKVESKINQAIGRILERYPRVGRYYQVSFENGTLIWTENHTQKVVAEGLDGGYLLRTDRKDLSAEEIWRIYMTLSRAESAFRAMKSPLCERPIFHQLANRVQAHIFLCVLAYHILISIEKTLRNNGIYSSWETIKQSLSTHRISTVVLPTPSGMVLRIRKATTPEPEHLEIYRNLGMSSKIGKTRKWWSGKP